MKPDWLLTVSFFCLVLRISWIISHWHGTVGFQAAYPVAGTSLQIAVSVTGFAALVGVSLTVVGALMLIAAFAMAFLSGIDSSRKKRV